MNGKVGRRSREQGREERCYARASHWIRCYSSGFELEQVMRAENAKLACNKGSERICYRGSRRVRSQFDVSWLALVANSARARLQCRSGPRSGRSMHACRFCGSGHASKTKLFNHLRESYACAAAAIAENPDAAASLCRAMSRAGRRQARWSDPRSWLAEAGWSLGQPEAPGRLRAAFQMAEG